MRLYEERLVQFMQSHGVRPGGWVVVEWLEAEERSAEVEVEAVRKFAWVTHVMSRRASAALGDK